MMHQVKPSAVMTAPHHAMKRRPPPACLDSTHALPTLMPLKHEMARLSSQTKNRMRITEVLLGQGEWRMIPATGYWR